MPDGPPPSRQRPSLRAVLGLAAQLAEASRQRPRRAPRLLGAALALGLGVLLAEPSAAQPAATQPADTTEARAPIRVSVRPIPAAFYSPSKGIGVGAAVTVRNVGWAGSEIEASAEPMTRFGRYGLHLSTGDPFRAPRFASTGVVYTTASRYPYFGLGPRTRRDDEVRTSFERVAVGLRLGAYAPGGRTLLLQPTARLLYGRVRGFEDAREGAFSRLDPASQANLLRASEGSTLGVTYGLEAVLDGTDTPHYPTRGGLAQASLRRYDGLGEDPARYWASTAGLYGFLPLGRPTRVLEARAVVALTRAIGERPIPFYELPALDAELVGGYTAGRLVGPDLVALSAGVRVRVLSVLGLFAGDGFVGFHAANAYNDLFAEASPSVSFARTPEPSGDRTSLRPALSLGGYIVDLGAGRAVLSAQIGVSPEGVELGTLRFVFDLRDRVHGVR
jgi:hypothetical protein